tara:strand:+ start:2139 stop:3314 length:1176 start_codon:yes stop_codon:yes gene_type:complete
MSDKQQKGQYFTTDPILLKVVGDFIKNEPELILEPSVGRGDLVKYVKENNTYSPIFQCYEIDDSIQLLDGVERNQVIYSNFLESRINQSYKTIIGNPPFVKNAGSNLYINFIEKCYNLLQNDGELIFIVPSNFFKVTSSSNIIREMLCNGTFTHLFQPNDENLFEEASVDVIVFRYCKNESLEHKTLINGVMKYLICMNGIVTFSDDKIQNSVSIESLFNVYVGMVSGKDSVFKNEEYGNVDVLNGKDKTERYIMIDEFPTDNNQLNEYLLENKQILLDRRIKSFNEDNWFDWGARRNIKNINKNLGRKCIYISNMSRKEDIAFVDKVRFFGGGLLLLIPINNVDDEVLKKVCGYFNSNDFKLNYMYSGRFKIGQRQLCNCQINLDIIEKT